MTDSTQKGASDNQIEAPKTHKAFPDPSEIPTKGNLDKQAQHANTQEEAGKTERPLSPRDQAIADIYESNAAQNESDTTASIAAGLQKEPEPIGEFNPDAVPASEPVPTEVAEDPLGKYAIMKDGEPMFKTIVDGKEVLVPFEKVRVQAQKHEAAEVRLRQAAEIKKALEDREANVIAAEQALASKMKDLENNPPSAPADEDNESDLLEARELVSTLMTGSEAEAAEKLAKVFAHNRVSAQQTPVDEDAIAQRAALAARQEMKAEDLKRDMDAGIVSFGENYPEIMADEQLFRYADGLSDDVAAEHPEYTPSQIMLEAGKRTRDWVTSISGAEPESVNPNPQPTRQSVKDDLVPMPRRASAATVESDPEEQPESPQDVFRDIRESRGQAM